jgi:hypothetical protein
MTTDTLNPRLMNTQRPSRVAIGAARRGRVERIDVNGDSCCLNRPMIMPLPEPVPNIDPDAPVPDDPAEVLADAPDTLPPAPIE